MIKNPLLPPKGNNKKAKANKVKNHFNNLILITMKREAFKMFLKPGNAEEYKRRHANLFPELRQLLTESGVRNYSIYLDEDTNVLYAYQELEGEGGSQDLGETEACKKWWAYMADIMETNPDNSPVSIPMPEMFHMD